MTRSQQKAVRKILLLQLLCLPIGSHAADRVSYDLVAGNPPQLGRLGLQWDWQDPWLKLNSSSLSGYWDASFSRWTAPNLASEPSHLPYRHDVGIAAVLRFQRDDKTGFYAEAGTGPHYLVGPDDINRRYNGKRFIFNTHAGIGFVWKNGLDLGLKATHVTPLHDADAFRTEPLLGLGLRYRW